jgi:hypothetical protein
LSYLLKLTLCALSIEAKLWPVAVILARFIEIVGNARNFRWGHALGQISRTAEFYGKRSGRPFIALGVERGLRPKATCIRPTAGGRLELRADCRRGEVGS